MHWRMTGADAALRRCDQEETASDVGLQEKAAACVRPLPGKMQPCRALQTSEQHAQEPEGKAWLDLSNQRRQKNLEQFEG